ncbi:DUF4013 domain-containing protein [Halorubrum halodurans]|uniref:DUF4013 domain-containing protein n=1 Tax=Halorubrum halodurans TaxID=1383851 RepID=A0A256IC51_9EURY|nr:DUF4013 domain-containing protein [Halorubrum halodurans]OYR54100.1 hypothetical protein DJ70_14760 [Halorubrum halodurans]
MLRAALATPLRSADAAGTLIVGTVLTLLAWVLTPLWVIGTLSAPVLVLAAPIALAPAFIGRGYLLRVVAVGIGAADEAGTGSRIGSAADASPEAPPFVRWGRLYRDGVASALLTAAYLLPLVVGLAAVGVAGAFVELGRVDPAPVAESVAGTDPAGVAGVDAAVPPAAPVYGIVGAFVAVVSLAYLVAFAYVRPAALSALAAEGRLRDGLRPAAVGSVALSGEYAVAWSLAMVTLLTGYVLAAPFVPLLVGVGGVFAVRVVVHTLYGLGAGDVIEHARSSVPAADPVADAEAPDESAAGSPATEVPPEADPAVQTGRSVPGTAASVPEAVGAVDLDSLVDGGGDGNDDRDGTGPAADRDEAGGGADRDAADAFDWGP